MSIEAPVKSPVAETSPPPSVSSRVGLLLAAACVFAIDAALPLGVAGSVLYLPVIWLAFRAGRITDIQVTAAVCSLLVVLDLFISPNGGELWKVALNRALGIAAIWMTAALGGAILQAKHKLAARDAYGMAIVENALDAVVAMDAHGRVLDWNSQAESIFGWTRAEATGKELASLIIPPGQRESHRAGLARYLQTGEAPVLGQRLELTALRKSGEEFPVELSVTAICLDDCLLFNAFVRDITQRGEAAEYRARMAALVDSSYDAIIGRDVAGTIMSWNLGAERVYGYTEEEAVGQTIGLILPPDVEREEPEILHAMETGQRLDQFETVRQRKDGRLIPVSLTVSPMTDAQGQLTGSSTIERDITERKQDEQELREAKEAAERAVRARAEFLANVSHELRTPMNAIIGMTQLALAEELPDDIRDYIDTANNSAHSLLTLLNDILDFSKLESGRFTIDNEAFHLRETIDETVKTLSARAFGKGLELACSVMTDTPDHLVGDAVRLRQILTNLISNAIKFTDQGEIVVEVETSRKWPQAARLRFTVRDSGVGISPRDQQRILEPFTQVDASSTRQYGGTGLGLAICNELLRLMGGRLSVESEPGKGSRFSFEISLALQPEASQETEDFNRLEALRQLPVLVVDDNETNRRIVAEFLTNWSMQPELASDGPQALGRLRRAIERGTPYRLVIVDALMPGMDGFALSRQIVERMPSPPPVILMLSSADRREFKRREEQAGISAYLQKPVSQSDLMDAVMRALNVRTFTADFSANTRRSSEPPVALEVLVAEDTPANQKVFTSILQKRGHAVTVAQNGREAIELCREHDFDVVLMDVQMPIMDGYQATAAIRQQERSPRRPTPIIAITAHAMHGDREKCLAAGMDAYLAKPIDVDEMIDLVESFANGGSGDRHHPLESQEADARPSGSSVIDFDGAMRRLSGDMELFHDFVGYFDEDSPRFLTDLRGAVARGDAYGVQRAAHALKGLAANFGAQSCTSAARDLELIGKSASLRDADKALSQLERELARLHRALDPYRNQA